MRIKICLLPNGNADEFPKLDAELKWRGINAVIQESEGGARIYILPEDQLHLLPHDERGPYLGDSDSGHSLLDFTQSQLDALHRICNRPYKTIQL